MKTIEKLIKQFNREFPHHTAYLDRIDSYSGNYHICVTDEEFGISSWYYFCSCTEFAEWMKGVVLE